MDSLFVVSVSRTVLDVLATARKLQEHAKKHYVLVFLGAIINSDNLFTIDFFIALFLKQLGNNSECYVNKLLLASLL